MRNIHLERGEDPLQVLYDQLHIRRFPSSAITSTNMPSTVTVSLTDANASLQDIPTHMVACFSSALARPYIIPVNVERFRRVFRTDIIPPSTPAYTRTNQNLTLPLVVPATNIPHPPSLVVLLLKDLTDNDIAFQMLPANVVGEFPNAAAMSQAMALIGYEEFERRFAWNSGIWRNVLGLGMQDERVARVVRTAWNVTADSRRLRLL